MQRKAKRRWDYKEYNATGKKVEKVEELSEELSKLTLSNDAEDQVVNETSNSSSTSDIQVQLTDRNQLDHPDQQQDSQQQISNTQEYKTEVTMAAANALAIEESTISDDIDDFLEENVVKEIGSNVTDHDEVCKRIEQLRTAYRGKHNQLKASLEQNEYDGKYDKVYKERMESIKEYMQVGEAYAMVKILRQKMR